MSDASEEKWKTGKHRRYGKAIVLSGLVAAVLSLGATFAIAHGNENGGSMSGGHGMKHGQAMQAMFRKLDTNGDGVITNTEALEAIAATMSANDANGNGSLNIDEFEGVWLDHMRSRMVDAFQRLDEDGNGEVSNAEMTDKRLAMMKWADRNGDGKITKGEMSGKRRMHGDDDDDDGDDGENEGDGDGEENDDG